MQCKNLDIYFIIAFQLSFMLVLHVVHSEHLVNLPTTQNFHFPGLSSSLSSNFQDQTNFSRNFRSLENQKKIQDFRESIETLYLCIQVMDHERKNGRSVTASDCKYTAVW